MNKYLFLSFVLIVFSCSDIIDIDIPKSVDNIVVNSLFEAGNPIEVEISTTTTIENGETKFVNDATVELWSENIFLEQFIFDQSGLYKSEIVPELNNYYKLIIKMVNGDTLICGDSIPSIVSITDAYFIYPAGFEITEVKIGNYAEAYVTFKDPGGEVNYYEISMYGSKYQSNELYGIETSSDDPNVLSEGISRYEPGFILLSDRNFNGSAYTLKMKFNSSSYWDNKIYVNVMNVSPAFFEYKKTIVKQLYYQEGIQNIDDIQDMSNLTIIGEPVNIYSNVVNGLGIFASYTSTTMLLEFKNDNREK